MGLRRKHVRREHRTERRYERLQILCDAARSVGMGIVVVAAWIGEIIGASKVEVKAAIAIGLMIMILALEGERRYERAYKRAVRDRIRKESRR